MGGKYAMGGKFPPHSEEAGGVQNYFPPIMGEKSCHKIPYHMLRFRENGRDFSKMVGNPDHLNGGETSMMISPPSKW